MNNTTACPLDCFDACYIEYNNEIKPSTKGFTHNYLCSHLKHYEKFQTIEQPRLNGTTISYEKMYETLFQMLSESSKSSILHYRGSGNFALMQGVTEHFFASFGATLTKGSLCDGAGEAGIIEGRGSNKNMPYSEIQKADVIVLWGRDPHITSTHLLPLLKNKKVIVINPIKIEAAHNADLFIQLKPHGDLDLALLLCRFLIINNSIDETYLEKYASEYEEFYELTQSIRIKSTLEKIDVSLGQIGDLIELLEGKKVAILTGVGVQKYRDGSDILRAIDSVGVFLGLFGKEGSGVSYLGNSKESIPSPFYTLTKKVSKVNTMFSMFETVFIQGANPLEQMPDSQRVLRSLEKTQNIIYFGLYENETSKKANLVIPAKTFLGKNDIRTSYAHNLMLEMPKQQKSTNGVSEYELTKKLSMHFNIPFESEQYYIEYFKSFTEQLQDKTLRVKEREDIPYTNGFDTDNGEFYFLEEYENDFDMENDFFLLTPKSKKSLNSQFVREEFAYIHSSLGYKENQLLTFTSKNGSLEIKVKHNNNLRKDCILIYSGTLGVNNLTSSRHSYEGECAIFQENKIKIS